MPTLKHVAEKAGVSMTTASRVLNGTYKNKVSELTRERVLRVVKEIGYRSSVPARALRSKKTFQYGLVLPNLAFSYVPEVVQGLQDVATAAEYGCLLYLTHDNPGTEEKVFETLISRRVDGIIWMPAKQISPAIEQLVCQCPVVEVLYRSKIPDLPGIMVDQEHGGYLAARHLLELGHVRIAAIVGTSHHWEQRLEGYRKAFAECGQGDLLALQTVRRAEWRYGVSAAIHLLEQDQRPTAILAASDNVAAGVLHAAQKLGLKVPQDLSVIGFGDYPVAMQGDVPLTSVGHPRREIGEKAMHMLTALMNREDVSNVELKPVLVKRNSTAPPSK